MTDPARCPGCGTAMIEQAETDGRTVVDFCAGCGGLWLDKGELEAEGARLPADLPGAPAAKPRACPRCTTPLDTVTGRSVELDLCRTCGGIYLDRGELRTLVERTEGDEAAESLKKDVKEGATNVGVGALVMILDALLSGL